MYDNSLQDLRHQAVKDNDPRKIGNEQRGPHNCPSFLPGENFQAVGQGRGAQAEPRGLPIEEMKLVVWGGQRGQSWLQRKELHRQRTLELWSSVAGAPQPPTRSSGGTLVSTQTTYGQERIT